MYAKRIQITNYGPIDQLDITFPFEVETPKPVVLVGENGSGKSIFLSHIVNGLIYAKDITYTETPEVETDKVYKIRSDFYIKSERAFYFSRVDFENRLFIEEMRSARPRQEYSNLPMGLSGTDAQNAWKKMSSDQNDYFDSNSFHQNERNIKDIFSQNCVLYFPPNRFEDPAWLNEENLRSKAQYMDLKNLEGYTSRKIINYSPLHNNRNWLFDVIYDRAVFEYKTANITIPVQDSDQSIPLPVLVGHSGNATSIYKIALQIVRIVMNRGQSVRFGIGRRLNRIVSIESEKQLVPDIFQMSAGETSLLNLFLSILRDFDLCRAPFQKPEDIRGIVVVDEIDLHLHAVHQYKILPTLIRMFPKVQFVITTHSPLFVLGMKELFGKDSFVLYRLPQGQPIDPEEFSEFANAYQAFTETSRFSDDIRTVVENAQKPIVYMEGKTDVKYLKTAYKLFGQETILEKIEIQQAGSNSQLNKIWNISKLLNSISQKIVLLYDCDNEIESKSEENIFRRIIPLNTEHPVEKGIENLFSKETLERAKSIKSAFIDITRAHEKTTRGKSENIPEKWEVNEDEKTNLCNWLCENGTKEDFQHFSKIFDLLQEILEPDHSLSDGQSPQVEQNGAEVRSASMEARRDEENIDH